MKYCIYCGKENDNDADFCIHCGKNISQTSQSNKKKGSKKVIIISVAVALVIAILLITILFPWVNSKETENNTNTISTTQSQTAPETELATTSETNSDRIYIGCYYNNEFSLILPDDWIFEIMDNQVMFYEKYNYDNFIEDTNNGYLGCIFTCSEDEVYDYAPNAIVLGEKGELTFAFSPPMGIGVSEDDIANKKLKHALDETNDVTESFEFSETEMNSDINHFTNTKIESNASTKYGGKSKYTFEKFWEIYEEKTDEFFDDEDLLDSDMYLVYFSMVAPYKQRSNYIIDELDDDNGGSVYRYTIDDSNAVQDTETYFLTEADNDQIYGMTLTQNFSDYNTNHTFLCISVLCDIPYKKAGSILGKLYNRGMKDGDIVAYNNIIFKSQKTDGVKYLTLLTASDEYIKNNNIEELNL